MGPYDPYIPQADCTLDICALSQGLIHYQPSIPGNVTYLAIFSVLVVLQLGLGIWFRTWGFLVAFLCGTALEVVGYVGRVLMHSNPFIMSNFLMYLICLTIGPAFLSAGIYLVLSRLITIYGRHFSPYGLAPRTYTLVFITCDFISLVLQGAGGGLAATASGNASTMVGVDVMIAGLAFQVFSLLLFMALCGHFFYNTHLSKSPRFTSQVRDPSYASLRESRTFRLFLFALAVATLTIFTRCCFRVAELQGGFDGHLANNETIFMILEAPMIIVAVTALTLFHPGRVFGAEWERSSFSLRGRKDAQVEKRQSGQDVELQMKNQDADRGFETPSPGPSAAPSVMGYGLGPKVDDGQEGRGQGVSYGQGASYGR